MDYSLYMCTSGKFRSETLLTDKGETSGSQEKSLEENAEGRISDQHEMTLEECVRKAILGGVTIVQLREKELDSRELYQTALSVKKVTDSFNVPLIINDRVDIALAVDAAGVHVGPKDLDAGVIRRLLGYDKIIGVSANNVQEALEAQRLGADYIGAGALFTTSSKSNTRPLAIETLRKIKEAVSIPVVAIGGINEENIIKLAGTGIDGVAVISAISEKPDIRKAAQLMCEMVKKIKTE